MQENNILMNVEKLKKYFPIYGGIFGKKIAEVKAVDNVSFTLYKGETLGLVGESGCGKSTTGRTLIKLYEATGGKIEFADYENKQVIDVVNDVENEKIIRKSMQMIFQDPYASLNPRMSIGSIIEEPLIIHGIGENKKERREIVKELLYKVGLAEYNMYRYPHEFSGGQRQRIGIARALAVKPSLIIADEPVSALDVSIQAQVLNIMRDLQQEYGLTYIFIAHDLSVVEYISDRVAVMYLGSIVEITKASELYKNPLHPYTKALLSAVPKPDPENRNKKRIILEGDVPNPLNKPSGCPFRTRCRFAKDVCAEKMPELEEVETGHFVACARVREIN
jgi:oligopeptide/dipeptide ABC transporter ATP-binding protein